MNRNRTLAERVASLEGVPISGDFMRHAAPGRDAFAGNYGGRWGEKVLAIYLGRPEDSCVEEAYRHLVDDAGVPAELIKPRILYTVRVDAENILDLRDASAQERVGLNPDELCSEVGDYEACQRVAATAHQLEFHGIIAPAATGLGETLTLFRQRIGINETPIVISEVTWVQLPPRPGHGETRLTLVRD